MSTRRYLLAGVVLSFSSAASAQSILPAVFVTNNVGDSVTSFTVNPDGTLNRVGVTPSGDGPQTISLSPNGRWLAVANGTADLVSEEMRIFEVNPDATLTQRLLTTVADSPLDVQWLSNSTLAVTLTNLSVANEVRTYNYNGATNTLSFVDNKPTGSFNTRLATARNGSLLYANNTLGANSIWAYEVDNAGSMTFVQNASTSPLFATEMAISNDERFLYGSGGISGTGREILRYEINPDGSLTQLSGFQSLGQSPKVIALTGDDEILIAGHGTDATMWSFLRDPATGDLTQTPFFFDVGLQGTLGDIKTMGDLIFVTDDSSAIDGITGIYSFRVNPDGSFTQLGPINDTLGARPQYIATWIPEPGVLSVVAMGGLLALRRRARAV